MFNLKTRLLILNFILLALIIGCKNQSLENKSFDNSDRQEVIVVGSLFNADQGTFEEQASIQVLPTLKQVNTDQNGNFLIEDIGRGQYQIIARKSIYTTSVFVDTVTTDFLSINMTFGTTDLNRNDLTFKENGTFVTKKLQDQTFSDFYASLINNPIYDFTEFGSMDWHPLTSNLLILSAKERNKNFNIYEYNLLTQEVTPLVESDSFDSTSPSYSPDGMLFSYLQNGEVYISGNKSLQRYDTELTNQLQWGQPYARCVQSNQPAINRKLIRDGRLIFRNLTSNKPVLKIQERNEQIKLADTETGVPITLPIVPLLPSGVNPVTGTGSNTIAVAQFRSLLNRYFNTSCYDNLGGIQECLNTIDQLCNGQISPTNSNETCALVFDQGQGAGNSYGSDTNFEQISPFDALNFPAECPVEMSDPVWSRSGNQIAFLARPIGCNSQRETVCGRKCDDTGWDIFLAPAVTCNQNAELNEILLNDLIKLNDFQRMDKFQVVQVTNDILPEINLSWDPKSNVILYEKILEKSGAPVYFLQSSNPTPLGFQTRVLLPYSPIQHFAQINQDGRKIVFVSRLPHPLNPKGISQIYAANWSGLVGKEKPVTFYTQETALSEPTMYKILPRK